MTWRIFLGPVLFTAFQLLMFHHTEIVLQNVPALWSVSSTPWKAVKLPTSTGDVFRLGGSVAEWEIYSCGDRNVSNPWKNCLSSESYDETCRRVAMDISTQTSVTSVTPETVYDLSKRIEEVVSLRSRIVGVMKLSNLLWIVGIMGLMIFVGPVFYHFVQQPLKHFLTRFYRDVLVPLHHVGVFEACLYMVCAVITAQGYRYTGARVHEGGRIAMVGAALATLTLPYSVALWENGGSPDDKELLLWSMFNIFACYTSPLAIAFDHSTLGFAAVTAFYSAFTKTFILPGVPQFPFFVIPTGARSDNGFIRMLITSMITLVLYVPALMILEDNTALRPFAYGVLYLGSYLYFFALFVLSLKVYWTSNQELAIVDYILFNVIAVVSSAATLAISFVWGISSIKYVSSLFFIVYFVTKQFEFVDDGAFRYLLGFANSAAVAYLAHYLSMHSAALGDFLNAQQSFDTLSDVKLL